MVEGPSLASLRLPFSRRNDIHRRNMANLRTHQDCDLSPRPVAALASDHPDGEHVPPHRHARAQLIHTLSGVMTVSGAGGRWVVPPGRAVWMPAHQDHAIRIAGNVAMRTVFVREDAQPGLPTRCEVIDVSPFLREAIVAATGIALDHALGGRDERVMHLILDEIVAAPRLDLHIALPRDPRLKACPMSFRARSPTRLRRAPPLRLCFSKTI